MFNDELVSIMSSALSAPRHVPHPDVQTKNTQFALVTFDIEEGLNGYRGSRALTEVGISAIRLTGCVNKNKSLYVADKLLENMVNKHFRVQENGSAGYFIHRHVPFAGTKSEFGQSEWVYEADLKREIICHLESLKKGQKGQEVKLIFLAFDRRLELKVLGELGINLQEHFFKTYDIQKLSRYVMPYKSQPSLYEMGNLFNVNTTNHHNGLNDAVYEGVVLINLIIQRAKDMGIDLMPTNFTAMLSDALERVRKAPQLTSRALLSMLMQQGKLCNSCGKQYHTAAVCHKWCINCGDDHPAKDKRCPFTQPKPSTEVAVVVQDSETNSSPVGTPNSSSNASGCMT